MARRYFFGGGDYPYECAVRTPLGLINPFLYSHHDVWTVSEIFCREDYPAGADLNVAVDVGSNIGISALYFLTRNSTSRCYLYEPDPRNTERLKRNLAPFAARWHLTDVAVGPESTHAEFGREPTGRYGGIGHRTEDVIHVRCVGINDVLETVLAHEGVIDILKIDTEGLERETVAAIRPDLLERISSIYFESDSRSLLHASRFDHEFSNATVRLRRRARPAPAPWE